MEVIQSKNNVPIRLTKERWLNITELKKVIDMVPQLLDIPHKRMWYSYDEEADVLYLNFKKPSHADDSKLTEDDIIIRYEKDEVVGITIINASKRRIKM